MQENKISVLKLYNVLLVTAPAEPDDITINSLQEEVLEKMDKYQTKGLILDISSVDTLDSFFARTLIETARMVMLMGGKTIIVGMRPNVAITATQLGLTLNNLKTALDIDQAFKILHEKNYLDEEYGTTRKSAHTK